MATMAATTTTTNETSLRLASFVVSNEETATEPPPAAAPQMHRYDAWLPYKLHAVAQRKQQRKDSNRMRTPQVPLYRLLGTSADDVDSYPHVLSPPLMESLRSFLPLGCSEDNFWMKYSLIRDGASYETLLDNVRGSQRTMIAIETTDGEVFGGFTSTPWKLHPEGYFGSGEAFLWRLKRSRFIRGPPPPPSSSSSFPPDADYIAKNKMAESDIEVYPFTGFNRCVQFCSSDRLALGGGTWAPGECPYQGQSNGLGLRIDNDLKRGSSLTNSTFANPMLYRTLLNGKNNNNGRREGEFEIANMEVWTLTPFTTVRDAEMHENRRLFIEENSNKSQ